jgi:rhodanese-related sulfurtransferase
MTPRTQMTARRALALLALCLGAAAAFAGSQTRTARVDAADARAADAERAIPAIEVARWIRERREHVHIVDVRALADYDVDHIPAAEHFAFGDLAKSALSPADTIVLYADDAEHVRPAVALLQSRGFSHVRFVRGGLYEWADDVMNPTIAADAPDSVRARFAETSKISRYFGGVPHVRYLTTPGDNAAGRTTPDFIRRNDALSRIRGRGC